MSDLGEGLTAAVLFQLAIALLGGAALCGVIFWLIPYLWHLLNG